MTKRTFWICTIVVALVGLSAAAATGWRGHAGRTERRLTSAAWKEKYKSAKEMVKGVDAVVLAQAVGASPGRVAFSSDGQDSLPFEVVEFRVVDGVKGFKEGDQVLVERAGGTDSEGNAVYLDIDGGGFEVGNTYLLFLKRQEEGPYYYQVNDQGRFQVEGGRLRAVTDDEVTAELRGRPASEAVKAVKEKAKEK